MISKFVFTSLYDCPEIVSFVYEGPKIADTICDSFLHKEVASDERERFFLITPDIIYTLQRRVVCAYKLARLLRGLGPARRSKKIEMLGEGGQYKCWAKTNTNVG
jgi:hypothetical protein